MKVKSTHMSYHTHSLVKGHTGEPQAREINHLFLLIFTESVVLDDQL